MSRKAVIAIALLFAAVSSEAQEPGDTSVAVMVTNVSATSSEGAGTNVDGGFGLAFNYWLTRKWSTEIQVSRDQTTFGVGTLETRFPDGSILFNVVSRTTESYPVDILAQYHFTNGTRWKPYVGFGAHYVDRPSGLDSRPEFSSNDFSAQVNVGTRFMFTPRFGLRLDTKVLLRGDSPVWDDNTKLAVGLSYKF
jgi:outer membrane protein W